MNFTASEAAACQRLVDLALEEDFGTQGDMTSQALLPLEARGRAAFVARQTGVLAGLPAARVVLKAVFSGLVIEAAGEDGAPLSRGTVIAHVEGPKRSILAAERTALNFMQRLSGVATQTKRFVDAVADLPCKILDTRKTTPGWRLLEKYAVRCGGGWNHRMGLYDGILIKDNHLAALGQTSSIVRATQEARKNTLGQLPVEVEVETLEQLDEALTAKPNLILLDNMNLDQMRQAVKRRNDKAPTILLEASGGVTLDTVRAIAETGVDRISVGALTHSAPALDIALDYLDV